MSEHCAAQVWDGRSGGYGCSRQGKVLEDGKWYCTQHSKAAKQQRGEKQRAKWAAADALRHEHYTARREQERRAACYPKLLAALEGCLPILQVAHDRGFGLREIEPVYNRVLAAIAEANGES